MADLAEELGVSVMTVRRDIDQLHEAGILQKIHGGAKAIPERSMFEPGFEAKSTQFQAEKEAIALAAAALVEEGMAIGLSAGTTTWTLARHLSSMKNLTVVSNSVQIAQVFYTAQSESTILLTGGQRTPSDALVGPMAIESMRRLHLDLLFLGVHGMDAHAGFTTPNMLEAEMDRVMVAASRTVVVVADHSKWDLRGVSAVASFEEVDHLITDDGLSRGARDFLKPVMRRLTVVPAAQ